MKLIFSIIFVIFLKGTVCVAQSPSETDVWSRAAKNIRYLKPSEIPGLPSKILHELERRGCLVPQPAYLDYGKMPRNAIKGEFAKPGQVDWIVMCSVGARATVLGFWGGKASCPLSTEWTDEKNSIQTLSCNEFGAYCENGVGYGFSGMIDKVEGKRLKHFVKLEGRKWTGNEHAGLENIFLGKASTLVYCDKGVWINLGGSD